CAGCVRVHPWNRPSPSPHRSAPAAAQPTKRRRKKTARQTTQPQIHEGVFQSYFLPNIHATKMLTMYKPIMGTARIVCVTMSGVGVMIAEMINAPRIAYLNLLHKKW